MVLALLDPRRNRDAGLLSLLVFINIQQNQKTTNTHCRNLERDTSDNQAVANTQQLWFGLSTSGNTTANALQDHRSQVATHKDPWVQPWTNYGMFGAKEQYEMFECQVDTSGQERWRQYQTANLHLESTGIPWVLIHEDPAHVA